MKNKIEYKLVLLSGFFILSLIICNLLATRFVYFAGYTLTAGMIIYPFTFMAGDVLTEVWGYKITRKIILYGFFAQLLISVFTIAAVFLPYPPYIGESTAFKEIFLMTPRIMIGSFVGYLLGELVNSYIMDKMKYSINSPLYFRTILSSVFGQILDSGAFFMIAFYGLIPFNDLLKMIVVQYLFKVLCEAVAGTPLAYSIIGWAKKEN